MLQQTETKSENHADKADGTARVVKLLARAAGTLDGPTRSLNRRHRRQTSAKLGKS